MVDETSDHGLSRCLLINRGESAADEEMQSREIVIPNKSMDQ